MYLRFVRPTQVKGLRARAGIFDAAHALRKNRQLDHESAARLEALLEWFRTNLPVPPKFHRSNRNKYHAEHTAGLSWFKPDATKVLAKVFDLKALLEEHGYPVEILRSDRTGYVVYEDAVQIVAEPFADTTV